MKTTITHTWTEEDPSTRPLEQAMNRLAEMQRGEDEPSLKAFRRVTTKGEAFTALNMTTAASYAREIADRARTRAKLWRDTATNPDCAEANGLVMLAQDLDAAAERLCSEMDALGAHFSSALELASGQD